MAQEIPVRVEARGVLVRVAHVAEDQLSAGLELRNGKILSVSFSAVFTHSVGTVLIFDEDQNDLYVAPPRLWQESTSVGVVKVKQRDRTLLNSNGDLILVPTSGSVEYDLGNTVEFSRATGVLAVISNRPVASLDLSDGGVDAEDFREDVSGLSFASDFAGSSDIIERAQEITTLPLKRGHLFDQINASRIRGVLFTGPPGTGKTLLARIIASESQARFYVVNGPEISSRYVGDTELALRNIFDAASKPGPAIIFFDELDSLASSRGESHESTRKTVGQLLALMDGVAKNANTLVIGTTNRLQDIDAALRRPGRFDWDLHFSNPTLADREEVLRISSSKVATKGELPHELVADRTDGWSSADLSAIWSEAALLAVADGRGFINAEDYLGAWQRINQRKRETSGIEARSQGAHDQSD